MVLYTRKYVIDSTADDYETDDEMEDRIVDVKACFSMVPDITVRAHLEYAEHFKDKVYAISDGGADSCVLGTNAVVTEYTGRFARLVGYDPKTTKSNRIPIVTGYIKAKAQNGIPVLLKINEAPYNKDSPITLLSEYQIRENKYVIDSVAKKHRTAHGYGTQRFQLNDCVNIPFEDRGGIMGFEILPIEEGEIDEIDNKLDIFEITSDAPWNPTKFRACMGTIEVASGMGGTLPMDGMSQDGIFQDSGEDFMTLLENDGLRNAKISFSADFMDTFLDNLSILQNQQNRL